MIEPFPASQPRDLPTSTASKERNTWQRLVGAPVLGLALVGAFGAATASAAPAAPASNSVPAVTDSALPTTATALVSSPWRQQPGSSQRNAVRSAQQYLEFSAFSRSGLIGQLEYEGYSTADATFAVDSLNVDWFAQAAESAEQYLEFTSFSRSGLIDQLVYEGFTREQAEFGADAAY